MVTLVVFVPSTSVTLFVVGEKAMIAESLVSMVTVKFVTAASAVLVGVRRRTRKFSWFSANASSSTVTVKVLVVTPAAKESSPLVPT